VLDEAYWITGALLCDIDQNGVPELFLNSGEVEYEMYYFTVRDGQVVYLNSCLPGNQGYTDALALCRNTETGEWGHFSQSITGSGAGSYHELCRLQGDGSLTVLMSYYTDYDDSLGAYAPTGHRVNGQECTAEAYAQAEADFAARWEEVYTYSFTDLGDDPAAALQGMIAAFGALK